MAGSLVAQPRTRRPARAAPDEPPREDAPVNETPPSDPRRLRVRIVLREKTVTRLPWTENDPERQDSD